MCVCVCVCLCVSVCLCLCLHTHSHIHIPCQLFSVLSQSTDPVTPRTVAEHFVVCGLSRLGVQNANLKVHSTLLLLQRQQLLLNLGI